jgi:hypothetical protein
LPVVLNFLPQQGNLTGDVLNSHGQADNSAGCLIVFPHEIANTAGTNANDSTDDGGQDFNHDQRRRFGLA